MERYQWALHRNRRHRSPGKHGSVPRLQHRSAGSPRTGHTRNQPFSSCSALHARGATPPVPARARARARARQQPTCPATGRSSPEPVPVRRAQTCASAYPQDLPQLLWTTCRSGRRSRVARYAWFTSLQPDAMRNTRHPALIACGAAAGAPRTTCASHPVGATLHLLPAGIASAKPSPGTPSC